VATDAQVKRQRLSALREVRRRQRATDTSIERLERRLFRMLRRKTVIDTDDAAALYEDYWRPFFDRVRELEQSLADFITVTML
jgi:hypothetical protein